MMPPTSKVSFSLWVFGILLIPNVIRAEVQVSAAVHIHSSISSGSRTIPEIAELAKKRQVDALIMTDLLCERFEYGIWPLRGWIKKVIERDSVLKWGAENYIQEIEKARQRVPEVLVIDGVAATPFYYWTGNIWPGPLVLNNRAKDLLALGLGEAARYENLPVIGNGKSRFHPYQGEQYSKPYQEFIDAVRASGGLSFWSHPDSEEHIALEKIVLDTSKLSYQYEPISTFRYTGVGISLIEMIEIDSEENRGIASAEGLWDRLLEEYCAGKREEPVWALGEVDYHGDEGASRLSAFLNIIWVKEKSPGEILNSLAAGKFYVITPDKNQTRRITVQDFFVKDSLTGAAARTGEKLKLEGFPILGLNVAFSDGSQDALFLTLVRDGKVLEQWKASPPFQWEYQDTSPSAGSKSYYRIIARTEDQDRLVTNPVFVMREESR